MSWIYLVLAGFCEIGWPIGLKLASGKSPYLWTLFAITAMALSGYVVYLAQLSIPMGTAYAIWTGIGAVGAFIVGIIWFKDPATLFRIISVSLIIFGIIGLKLSAH